MKRKPISEIEKREIEVDLLIEKLEKNGIIKLY